MLSPCCVCVAMDAEPTPHANLYAMRGLSSSENLLLLRQLALQLACLLDRFARGEIFQLEELPNLNLRVFALVRSGCAHGPLDGLVSRLGLNDPITGDQTLRVVAERSFDQRAFATRELD